MLAIHRTLVLVALLGFPSVSIWAADCGSKQQIIDSLRARIKADQNAIRQLNPRITAEELDKWAVATEAERQDILKKSIESTLSVLLHGLVDKVLSAPETALKSWNIAGYHLPNGIGSLGTGQANAIIGRLQRSGAGNTVRGKVMISSIRELSSISNKQGTLQFANQLARTAKVLKGASEVRNGDDSVETAGAVLQLVADLAGKGDFSVALGSALFQGVKNQVDAYLISSTVGELSITSEKQLAALRAKSAILQQHVQALQQAKVGLEECRAHTDVPVDSSIEGSWTLTSSSNTCDGGHPEAPGRVLRLVLTGPNTLSIAGDARSKLVGTAPGRYVMRYHEAETPTTTEVSVESTLTTVNSDTIQLDSTAQFKASGNVLPACIIHQVWRRSK